MAGDAPFIIYGWLTAADTRLIRRFELSTDFINESTSIFWNQCSLYNITLEANWTKDQDRKNYMARKPRKILKPWTSIIIMHKFFCLNSHDT